MKTKSINFFNWQDEANRIGEIEKPKKGEILHAGGKFQTTIHVDKNGGKQVAFGFATKPDGVIQKKWILRHDSTKQGLRCIIIYPERIKLAHQQQTIFKIDALEVVKVNEKSILCRPIRKERK